MGQYCNDIHAGWKSQLGGAELEIDDSEEIKKARSQAKDYDGFLALGKALSWEFRYREAAEAYDQALNLKPDDLNALRLKAGRHLSTLHVALAEEELKHCLELGGDELDIRYRLGLCSFFMCNYDEALHQFSLCMPLCGDEMGIAAMYWHTLSAYRSKKDPILLKEYRPGMEVGHHTAYEKAMALCACFCSAESLEERLQNEPDDMEYAIMAYGLSEYYRARGNESKARALAESVLKRDGFWPCFAWLAAKNDEMNRA